ncbi:4-hydroxybenzoyl-CoA thioesterase [Comamonas serinivorans]|uniref:4-hydroxybenzoyl-CoA thioesterase n=1 Tax=Comamonas serinivorans TaxID=1082851 RepID=A0A1Y0ENA1_9BURK|nr:YbgC/FadM family acyl-CoA thioesterase [Comamonas serinivorans]ARU05087.1 4-hydroxybenzoyl-CoA thioesterase [Comamonas serinivorans]
MTPSTASSAASTTLQALFTLPVRIYWEDTDAGGIVYHANYLKFFERARTEWLRARGIHQQHLRDALGGGFVVSDMQIRFIRPARLDDELLATCQLESAGQASLVVRQRLIRAADAPSPEQAPALCEATARVGWVDLQRMRPGRLPAQLLEQLQP